jgi:hypothetical protein
MLAHSRNPRATGRRVFLFGDHDALALEEWLPFFVNGQSDDKRISLRNRAIALYEVGKPAQDLLHNGRMLPSGPFEELVLSLVTPRPTNESVLPLHNLFIYGVRTCQPIGANQPVQAAPNRGVPGQWSPALERNERGSVNNTKRVGIHRSNSATASLLQLVEISEFDA